MSVVNLSAPRFQITGNGSVFAGVKSLSTEQNNNFTPDKFSFQIPINANPDPNWYLNLANVRTEFYAGNQPDTGSIAWGDPFLIGVVDGSEADWDTGLVTVHGRDLSAVFRDNRTKQSHTNMTASEVVEFYANNHGIDSQITATKQLVGALYDKNRVLVTAGQFSRERTEWEIMVQLAQLVDYDLYMDADTLVFEPSVPLEQRPVTYQVFAPTFTDDGNLRDYNYADGQVISPKIQHNTNMSKGVGVLVQSFNEDRFAAYTGKAGNTDGDDTPYTFKFAGLTQQECDDKAKQLLQQILQHLYHLSWTTYGEMALGSRDVIGLSGTGSDADQKYVVINIHREWSFEDGFTETVSGKNIQPASEGGDDDL